MDNCVLLRQSRSFSTFPLRDEAGVNVSFSEQLANLTEETQRTVFTTLIEQEASEALKYNALRALLRQALSPPILVDKATILDLVNEALDLAKILTKKYDLYINEHGSFLSKRTLLKHQRLYTSFINASPVIYTKKQDKMWTEICLDWFKTEFTTERMNPRRLYALRERRLLVLLAPLIKDFANYSSWIIWADAYVAPFLMYLGAVFFLPRLIFNLCTLCDNVFDEDKMKPEAKKLGPGTRFMAQWMRLWPQLMNDLGWTISGILMCAVFIAAWQPLAIYLSVAMQFYDVIMATIRVCIDFNRLNQLAEQYENLPSDPRLLLDARYRDLHPLYCQHLKTSIQREKWLLYLALVNASVLFLAVCLSLPFMVAISPLFPIIGAVLAIIMTVINFEGRNYLNRPESKTLDHLLELGQPACPVTPSRASSAGAFNLVRRYDAPLPLEQDQVPQQNIQTLPIPILVRGQSSSNAPRFFSTTIMLYKSQSYQEVKSLSGSSSPTGIAISHSMDDLDAYMEGGITFR